MVVAERDGTRLSREPPRHELGSMPPTAPGRALSRGALQPGPSVPPVSCANRLLAALPSLDYARLRAWLHPVDLVQQQVLYDPAQAITHAYFPTTAVVALLIPSEDGTSVETALVGAEGMVGLPLAFAADCDTHRAMTQVAGTALRLPAAILRGVLADGRAGALRPLLHRYTQFLLAQMAQGAACNRLHPMYGRCARWFLETHDRVQGVEFAVTQDLLASLLAVRRATISVAAGALQEAGLIRYRRGHVTILCRAGLEAAACECYRVIRGVADRLGTAA
jgi:CRP-like cAMP-binding protein